MKAPGKPSGTRPEGEVEGGGGGDVQREWGSEVGGGDFVSHGHPGQELRSEDRSEVLRGGVENPSDTFLQGVGDPRATPSEAGKNPGASPREPWPKGNRTGIVGTGHVRGIEGDDRRGGFGGSCVKRGRSVPPQAPPSAGRGGRG
jgi:hypothetical protein